MIAAVFQTAGEPLRIIMVHLFILYQQSHAMDSKIKLIRKAIENEASLEIVYLKPSDEKTTRVVSPEAVGEMEYCGKKYLGMRAFCLKRNEERVFRIDRILEMREVH